MYSMSTSKYASIIKKFAKRPIFTAKEAKEAGLPSRMLSYFCKKGLIERIERGIYTGSQADLNIDFQWEDLATIAISIPQGVICLISALSYYKLTDQIMRQCWIAVPHSNWPPQRPNTRIVRMRNTTLGQTQIQIGKHYLKIFDRERTIIDAFRYLSVEVAVKALKMSLQLPKSEKIDLVKLQEYAKQLRVNIDPYLVTMTIE